jgi:hypothetical protein
MLMNRLEDIMPNFWDNDFGPLSCGIIEVWATAERNTRLKLYSSPKLGDTELQNPYHLTSAGRAKTPVYFKENGAFVVVKNKDGVPIKSYEYETSNAMQGDLNVENDVKAGRNLESEEDTIVGRTLDVKGNALIKGKIIVDGDITAENATINNKTATKDLTVSNHAETKTLKVTGKADIDVLNVLGSILVNGATLDKIEIAKSMKFGALNVFVAQTFTDEPIVNAANYIRCVFTELVELGDNTSNVKFMSCAFNKGVKLAANSYNSLYIEDCFFADGKKIDLTNPACVFSRCKIRRNESLGSNPYVPINMELEGALFKIEDDGRFGNGEKYKLKTNLIATKDLMERFWNVNFIIETITHSVPSDNDVYVKSLYGGHVLETQRGSQGELEVKISTSDMYDITISYIRFIPGGV